MRRLFFAFWPDDGCRERCRAIIEKIPAARARPIAAKNLHSTLLFLGSIDETRQFSITAATEELKPRQMNIEFDRLSYWTKPGVLCLTASRFDPEISLLAKQLANKAIRAGLGIDNRPFTPHITLARKAKARIDIEFAPVIWKIDAFYLVESISSDIGVEYKVIKRWNCLPPESPPWKQS